MGSGFRPPVSEMMSDCRSDVVGVLVETDEPLTTGELAAQAGIDPSTFYRHRAFLEAWGLLESEREGKRWVYELASSELAEALVRVNERAYEQERLCEPDEKLVRKFLD